MKYLLNHSLLAVLLLLFFAAFHLISPAFSISSDEKSYQLKEYGVSFRAPNTWATQEPTPEEKENHIIIKLVRTTTDSHQIKPVLKIGFNDYNDVGANFGRFEKATVGAYKLKHKDAKTYVNQSLRRVLFVSNNRDKAQTESDWMADIFCYFAGSNEVISFDFDIPFDSYTKTEEEVYDILDQVQFMDGWGPEDNSQVKQKENEGSRLLEMLFQLLGLFLQVGFFLVLLIIGYVVGKFNEAKHFKSLKQREALTAHQPMMTSKLKYALSPKDQMLVAHCSMVCGSMVISEDYFKRILGSLRCFFGGNIASYETLLDRARREALLRMKAQQPHADMYINIRLESSSVSQGKVNKNSVSSIEVIAYGTAIHFKHGQSPLHQSSVTQQQTPAESITQAPLT